MDLSALIRIGGLGIAGSYLLNRLKHEGFDCEGYDPRPDGFLTPCGYAVNWNVFSKFAVECELEPGRYLQARSNDVIFKNSSGKVSKFRTSGLCTIDKNRFVNDLVGDIPHIRNTLKSGMNGIIIDATGISRSLLGPSPGDFTMKTMEYIVPGTPVKDFLFSYFPSGRGYYWEFPMDGYSHIGAGSDDINMIRESLSAFRGNRVLSRNIRLAPLFDNPVSGNIIGVGEAVGTVSPITGEGIGPSLECAEILMEILKNTEELPEITEKYRQRLKIKFARFRRLFALLERTRRGKLLSLESIAAIRDVRRDFENFGIDISLIGLVRSVL